MNTLEYSLLVKDYGVHKKIERLQKIKTLLFWLTIPVCFLPFIGVIWVEEIPVLAMMFSLITIGALGYELGFIVYFHRFIERCRREQVLVETDETDGMFLRLNEKYSVFYGFDRKTILTAVVVGVAGLFFAVVLIAIGAAVESEPLMAAGIIGFVLFFIVVLGGAVISVFKQISFASKAAGEVEQIKRYFYRLEGLTDEEISKKKKNIFTNVYENQKVLKYLYPDEGIRKKMQKVAFTYMMPLIFVGGIFGGFVPTMLENGSFNNFYIALCVFAALFAGAIAFYTVSFSRIVKKQRAILEANADRYKYHIALADETKRYQKKSNIATGVIFGIVIAAGIIIWQFIPQNYDAMLGTFFGLLFFFLALEIVYLIIFYGRYRKKAKLIEIKIDAHLAEIDAVFGVEDVDTSFADTADTANQDENF